MKLSFAFWMMLLCSAPVMAQPPLADRPYLQDTHATMPLGSLEENDVHDIVFDSKGRLWVATAAGVRVREGEKWATPSGGRELGATHSLYADRSGTVWVGAWNGLFKATPERVEATNVAGTPIGAVAGLGSVVFAGGPEGIWRFDGKLWAKVKGRWQPAIRALLPTNDNKLWIATASGLYLQDLKLPHRSVRFGTPDQILSSNVQGLAQLPDGRVAVSSTGGVDFYLGAKRVGLLSVAQGMPTRNVRSAFMDTRSRMWIATNLGAVRYDKGRMSLRHSRRWVSSDDVRDVITDKAGNAYIATAKGVDLIRQIPMSLKQKADYFNEMVRARHIRTPGLVGPAVLNKRGDLSSSFIEDDDNDGEHTGMWMATESLRFAVTRDPQAQKNARDAFHAMMLLQSVTGTSHFIARSVLPIDTKPRHEVDRSFTLEETAEIRRTDPREKIIEQRWVPSADGKWLWKRDASSDEVDGHMFGYAVYYDLAADAAEKRLVADQVDRIVGGILDHGYKLQDIDGKGTRWGNWSPESLNSDPLWNEERCGNSTEILSYLGVAYHMTRKQRYLDAARTLIDKHGYAKNMAALRYITPSERTHINDQLNTMVYHNLFTHVALPELRTPALQGIRSWHQSCAKDRIPFYDFVYNRFSGKKVPLDGAVETLRDWPLDMIEWTVDNRSREDVKFDLSPGLDPGRLLKLVPRSEMGICMWDQEPYRAVIGLDGAREDKPTDWLLAYWMGRYYGLLAGK